MKRKMITVLIVAAFLALAIVAGQMFYMRTFASPLAPVITFDDKVLLASVSSNEKSLLEGVTAYDPEDGDVTDSLIVESMSNITNGNSVKVTYVAFDSKNHMGRATRTVRFTDYEPPKFDITRPLVFRSSNTINVLNYVKASDVFDGDISHKTICSLVGNTTDIKTVGIHEVELRVTNSKGDMSRLAVEVEVTRDEPNSANISLKQYIKYISVGEAFSPQDYFKSYQSEDGISIDSSGISIDSNVDTETPGVYYVTYSAVVGGIESHTRLIVVVE